MSESDSMAARPAPAPKAPAKTAPAKKAAANQPAPAAPKTKVAAASVVTLKTVFEQLGEAHDLPKEQALALLEDFVTAVTTLLKNGERVRVSGLGTLEVKTRPARMGRNPATGEAMPIKAGRKVTFRPAKELKEAV